MAENPILRNFRNTTKILSTHYFFCRKFQSCRSKFCRKIAILPSRILFFNRRRAAVYNTWQVAFLQWFRHATARWKPSL